VLQPASPLRSVSAPAKQARSFSGWPRARLADCRASLFATNIGAEHLVGLSGDAYRYGLCAGTVELTTCICLGVACAFLFPYYLRMKSLRYRVSGAPVQSHGSRLLFWSNARYLHHDQVGISFVCRALVLHGLFGWSVMSTSRSWSGYRNHHHGCGFTAVAYTDSIQTIIMIAGSALSSSLASID